MESYLVDVSKKHASYEIGVSQMSSMLLYLLAVSSESKIVVL